MAILTGMRSVGGGDQLLGGHLEAAVAVDGPHRAVGPADLGADGRRHREAHRAEAAGVDPRVGMVELPVLRRPHLVLADARGDDRVLGRAVAQLLEHELRLEQLARLGRLVGQRELLLPAADRADFHAERSAWAVRAAAGRRIALISSSITRRQSPTIGTSGRRTLPSSAGSMSTWMILASGANAGDLAGDPVVEAAPEGDQQVGLLHRGDRGVVAVHARACRGTAGGRRGTRPGPSAW